MKKKLLVLNMEFPPIGGGASPVSYDIANALSSTGDFDIDVITMGMKGLPKFEKVNDNFRIHRVNSFRRFRHTSYPHEQLIYLINAFFKWRAISKNIKFDLIHSHFIIPTGALAYFIKKTSKINYFLTAHGSDVLYHNPRFDYLYKYLEKPWNAILNNSLFITTPSQYLKDNIVKINKDISSKIYVIPNPIIEKLVQKVEKKNIILASGRVSEKKGFQYLVEAVSGEDLGYELNIAGDGPYLNTLKGLAKNSKTKIVFHGWLDNKSKSYRHLFASAKIFVSLSPFESFGIVVAEAIQNNCVCVVSSKGASKEVVGEYGVKVDEMDVLDVRRKIKHVISHYDRYDLNLEKARARVDENFSINIVANKFKELIYDVI